jgi:surface polysaccharide O-acyltransferase-like enzyme
MFIQGMGQTLFKGVPLFLMLTGYLNINKQLSKKYYRGGLRVIYTYLLISVITILFRVFYLGEEMSPIKWFLKITDFSAIPYAWYIEMWIGLFLLTPFLNILWKNIPTKRNKQILILTLYLCSALPDFFNRYGVHLAPGWWEGVWPTVFFFLGCYIREYRPAIKKRNIWLMILGLCLINSIFNVVVFHGSRPMIHLIGDCNGLVGIPLSALLFLALYDIDIKNGVIKKIFERISLVSLEIYLVSWMFDQMVYAWGRATFPQDQSLYGLLFFLLTAMVFIGSYVIGEIIRAIARNEKLRIKN